MTEEDLNQYLERFEDFVDRYRDKVSKDTVASANIDLKFRHSMRVLENARRITDLMPKNALDQRQRKLCLLASLFHDIGRFPQYDQYKTFADSQSVNHGTLGAATLLRNRVLSDLPAGDRRILYGATAMHNQRYVPPRLSEDLRLVLTVTRDSDKLDIIYVMLGHFQPQGEKNDVVTLNLRDHPTAYSQRIYDDLFARRQANYLEMVYINDFKLLLLSWIHDIVHQGSFMLLRERGYMEAVMETLPPGEAMLQVKKYVREVLNTVSS